MEDEMAPPNKRRRLSEPPSLSLPSHSDFTPEAPSPTLLHSVEHLRHKSPSAARTVPRHIQDVHKQIQERGLSGGHSALHRVHPRQATAVVQLVTSVNELGEMVTQEITVGATTSPVATPTGTPTGVADTSSALDGTSNNSTNISSPSTSISTSTSKSTTTGIGTGTGTAIETGTGTGTGTAVSSGTATSFSNSGNSTSTHTLNTESSAFSSGHAKLPKSVYRATLTNDQVVTVTRLNTPYKTTFADGEVSTICDRQGQCKLSDETGKTQTKQSPTDQSPTHSSASTLYSTAYVAGTPAASSVTTSASSSASAGVQNNNNNNNNNDDSTPPPATIAGGVVGGAAGLAVIVLLALILLRWYKRRRQFGHHALPPSSTFTPDPDPETPSTRGPGMAERAGLRPLVNAVPAFFRHQDRREIEPPSSERSFQKVSGRKLPSAFSEGMTSADMTGPGPAMPLTTDERNLSSLSFYRDSQGFYGGEGEQPERAASPDAVPPLLSEDGGVSLSPGPQRRPTVHAGGPYIMSPSSSMPSTPGIHSPTMPTIPGSPPDHPRRADRSSTPSTVPDNRSSRFTEEV